jgi:hypothetical protein
MSWDLAVNRKSVGVQIGTNLGFYNMLATARKKVGPSAWPSQRGSPDVRESFARNCWTS